MNLAAQIAAGWREKRSQRLEGSMKSEAAQLAIEVEAEVRSE